MMDHIKPDPNAVMAVAVHLATEGDTSMIERLREENLSAKNTGGIVMKEYVFTVRARTEETCDGEALKQMIESASAYFTPEVTIKATLDQIKNVDPREEG